MASRRAARETIAQPTNNRVVTLDEALQGEIDNSSVISTLPYSRDAVTPDDYIEDDDSDVERICAELGEEIGSSFIKVYEVSKTKGEPEADLFRCEAAEWDTIMDRIRNEFIDRETGEGTFHLKGFKPQVDPDTGERSKRVRLFMNRFIRVKVSKTWLIEQERRKAMQSNGDNMQRQLEENQRVMLQGMKDMQASFIQAIQTMSPKQESRLDMLKEMELMRNMFAPPVKEERDPLEVVEKMLAIKGKLDMVGGNGENNYLPMVMEMAKPMLEGLKQQNANQAAQQPATPPQPTTEDESMTFMMKMMLNRVMKAAENNSDPYTYASLILEHAPDDVLNTILTAPNWFEQLCVMLPEAAQYKTWFVSVRQEMVELTTPDESDNPTPTHHVNPSNVPNTKT